jgi:4-hydroxybenzoate polyprenyltransferase
MLGYVQDLLRLIRPHQWIKNAFVLAGVLFGHEWRDPEKLGMALAAAAAFSLVSSSIYIVNDMRDVEQDRQHPRKRDRPLARGAIALPAAAVMAVLLFSTGFALALLVSRMAAALVGIYFVMNLAYSMGLKHVVILDVFIIAMGFMLRILVGTIGIDIVPSEWLLFCGLMVTLFLGFTKRRAELYVRAGGGASRQVLDQYTPLHLDIMIGVTVACVIMSYTLYTMSERTIRIHGTENLIYTVPFVIYGLFRYIHLLHSGGGGEDTAKDLIRDPHILVTGVLWVVVTVWLIGY